MIKHILNVTQHDATPDQIVAGVVEPEGADKSELRELLTFKEPPCRRELQSRAERIARIVDTYSYRSAMIGGAPFFMSHLERALTDLGITPVYAFSTREVVEVKEGGTVRKASVFRHSGWVEA